MVAEEIICKCYKKSGNPHSDVDDVSSGLEEDDGPFSECDLQQETESLIHKTTPADGRCTLKEYMEGDNELQVCVDKGSDDWVACSFDQLALVMRTKSKVVVRTKRKLKVVMRTKRKVVMRTKRKVVIMKLMKTMRLKWC